MMKALYKEKGAQFRIELLEIPYSDDKVRPEHAVLNRVTLPITDKFREKFYPPNGWGCRCTEKVGHASAPDLAYTPYSASDASSEMPFAPTICLLFINRSTIR